MKAISFYGTVDTNKAPLFLIFNSDEELNEVLHTLATSPVNANGLRVVTFLNRPINEFQRTLLDVVHSFDGLNSDNYEERVDSAQAALLQIAIEAIEELPPPPALHTTKAHLFHSKALGLLEMIDTAKDRMRSAKNDASSVAAVDRSLSSFYEERAKVNLAIAERLTGYYFTILEQITLL